MRPLDRLRSVKVKLGIVIVVAVAAAYVVNLLGLSLNYSFKVRVVVAVLLSLVMVQLLAHGMISPLREMAAAARAMARGDYSLRVRATSGDEVGELARAFNRMAADLATVDRQRRDLVANASHELRTPITALQALLENLVDGVEQPGPQTLQVALEQIQRLGRLVSELLDLSQLESGGAQLVAETLSVQDFVEQAVNEAALTDRNVRLTADVVPATLTASADPARLHQVLANLLDNASRHSPPGGLVTVSARQSADGIRLAVIDQGPGIPAADRDRVFERFSRLDRARTSQAGGGGLGLAIAREVVELHGGTLRAEENTPSGCRMVVDLPTVHKLVGELMSAPVDEPAIGAATAVVPPTLPDPPPQAAPGWQGAQQPAPAAAWQQSGQPVWTQPAPPGWRPAPPPPGWQPPQYAGMNPGWPQHVWAPPSVPPTPKAPPADPPPRVLLGAVLAAGVVAAISMPPTPPGIGLMIGAVAVGAAVVLPLRRHGRRWLGPWPVAFGALAYTLVAMTSLRAAPWVATVNLLAAIGLGSLAVSRAVDWSGIVRTVPALALAAARAPRWTLGPNRHSSTSGRSALASPALRGALVAALLLAVFGTLFISADAAFADILSRGVPQFNGALIVVRVFVGLAAITFAGAAALLAVRPALTSGQVEGAPATARRRIEWVLPLTALNLLFAAFVAVQLTVLFGGDEHVLRTTGLTYADYAHQGFWQLLVAAALTLGVVALAVRLVPREQRGERVLLRVLLGCLCALTLVVLASAVRRLDLYEEAYGLTRLRISAQAVAYWLAGVFVLTIIAGAFRRAAWLPRAAVASIAIALVWFAMSNPDARIAHSAEVLARHGQQIDVSYLSTLSSDAVPTLQQLPDEHDRACALAPVAARLDGDTFWANWNLARRRADEALHNRPPARAEDCKRQSRSGR